MMTHSLSGAVRLAVLGLSAGCMLAPGGAGALEIDTGNPDLVVRFDNTLRYNIGVRAQAQDKAILGTANNGNSDAKFDKGDLITNRLDLLSEFDLVFQESTGFRVSAQAWYDAAYDGKEELRPGGAHSYPNGRYTSYVKRWNRGPSGEILDAFLFKRFSLGDTETMLRLGKHNLYWGESLFSFVHGVSYSQGPVDVRKAFSTPGIEAKELFKPLNQVSLTTQVTDTLSFGAQYLLDWKPTSVPDGGTYWGITDSMTMGGGTSIGPRRWIGIFNEPDDKSGDWGVMARWSPQWLGGSFGVYYREYTDKMPQIVLNNTFTQLGFNYLDDRVKLTGVSLSKNVGGINFGAEVLRREGTGLLMGGATTVGNEPIGDTWHALVNAVGYAGKTPLFDSMSWMAELTYSEVDKVRKNKQNFKRKGTTATVAGAANCSNAKLGCADHSAVGIALRVEPRWFQVFDGVDLSMPIFYRTNFGTSPVLFGGYDGNGSWSVGLNAEYLSKYTFTLAYNGYFAKHKDQVASGVESVRDAGALGYHWDRGNVTLTFKTSF
jgi:hypothetical protein